MWVTLSAEHFDWTFLHPLGLFAAWEAAVVEEDLGGVDWLALTGPAIDLRSQLITCLDRPVGPVFQEPNTCVDFVQGVEDITTSCGLGQRHT